MIRGAALFGLPLLWLWTTPALADARSDVLAGIDRCSSFADDRVFLNCVYGAAQPLRASLGLAPAPAAQTSLVPTAAAGAPPPVRRAATPQRRGGIMGFFFDKKQTQVPAQPLASYSFDSHSTFTVTLSNGQVWRQADGDTALAHWRGPASKLVVTVLSGAFGSSLLQVQGEGETYKVSRIH